MSQTPVRQRFVAALDALLADVRHDRSVLAAIICGSLSHDTVWEKSDIDLVLVTIDDRKVATSDLALYADGVNVHAILLPRADIARAALPEGLRARGAEVVEVDAYRTVQDGSGAEEVRRRLDAGEIDLVTFTAASTARSFAELVGTGVGAAKVASIGPITSGTVRELGMRVDVEAEEATIAGLLRAVRGLYTENA